VVCRCDETRRSPRPTDRVGVQITCMAVKMKMGMGMCV
jgi:hypothetical protein